ncbi:hypothetical protein [Pseudomonas amygdali]|uniref:hypothetical protein n=1 Tax=Pseudomonas amygdali TaxID=47877 RepID=UPI0006B99ED3|nr:hypothetical protein [Pseudomonas amygdali]KPB24911.1 Uncharacterized protein AC516_5425 [Pseudomonas amygdali pv. sesami]KPY58484.1 Uncharacterized protein ALO93_02565 [Pseudomonas amygdali pv. sesami]RMT86791.1 hypothetical protein ALP38_00082 [Pseudomonas amygdali pv. sesami]RMU02870.1 hypothetical protein ALP37_100678 [Pseudomonas amygdali pv. sesami]RMV87842.1 hypothetical protein ALP04_00835 [Pseudomonas amygdali pv. sesami]
MTFKELKGYVSSADADLVRLESVDQSHYQTLLRLGFVAAGEPGIHVLGVMDEQHKARVFDALRLEGIAFSGGREWCPAQVFEYMRDKGLLSGAFLTVVWTAPGQYRVVHG